MCFDSRDATSATRCWSHTIETFFLINFIETIYLTYWKKSGWPVGKDLLLNSFNPMKTIWSHKGLYNSAGTSREITCCKSSLSQHLSWDFPRVPSRGLSQGFPHLGLASVLLSIDNVTNLGMRRRLRRKLWWWKCVFFPTKQYTTSNCNEKNRIKGWHF